MVVAVSWKAFLVFSWRLVDFLEGAAAPEGIALGNSPPARVGAVFSIHGPPVLRDCSPDTGYDGLVPLLADLGALEQGIPIQPHTYHFVELRNIQHGGVEGEKGLERKECSN